MNKLAEEIGILEEMIENANIENMDMNDCFGGEHIEAIEHILQDYKKVLKENEELEEINNELEAEKNEAIRRYNFETIPFKKVKDKIEELNKEIKSCAEIDAIFKIKQQQILQELLERKKI